MVKFVLIYLFIILYFFYKNRLNLVKLIILDSKWKKNISVKDMECNFLSLKWNLIYLHFEKKDFFSTWEKIGHTEF